MAGGASEAPTHSQVFPDTLLPTCPLPLLGRSQLTSGNTKRPGVPRGLGPTEGKNPGPSTHTAYLRPDTALSGARGHSSRFPRCLHGGPSSCPQPPQHRHAARQGSPSTPLSLGNRSPERLINSRAYQMATPAPHAHPQVERPGRPKPSRGLKLAFGTRGPASSLPACGPRD